MQALTFFFAFVAVLALIGAAAWLVRRFAGNRLGANTNRGRMPRLAVIDAAAVDGRRRLVLVRRDNVEHLLMIGGPTDIVVEPNIVRAMPGRDQMPPRPAVGGVEPQPRIVPLPDAGNWSDGDGVRERDGFDHRRAANARAAAAAGPAVFCRRSAPPGAGAVGTAQRSADLTGFAPEPLGGRPEPRPELRGEPMPSRVTSRNEPMMPRPPRPSEAPKAAADSRARARRRTAAAAAAAASLPPALIGGPKSRRDGATAGGRACAGRPATRRTARRRAAGRARAAAGRAAPRSEPPTAPPVAAPSTKSGFENLEDEMASLLGRPKTPS